MENTEIVKQLNEVKETVTGVLSSIVKMIDGLIESFAPVTPAAPPAPPAAPAAPVELTMTPAANGMTYQQYKDAGWTDEQMITNGVAVAPVAAPPAPPANTPAAPAAVTTPKQLNEILVQEFNRIGDRKPIDAAFKELGFTNATDLPPASYQALIDKVKAIPSKAV